MDIKYVYIQGERRNVYLLSVMDIFTRRVLGHLLKSSIRQHDVVLLLDGIISGNHLKRITIRNDNGSQFIANSVRKYLHEMGVNQEFTHIATPEENAFIESLHSTLEREVIRRYWFDSIHYAKWKISDYYKFYNARRKHRSLGMKSPEQYLDNYEKMNQRQGNNFQILLN
jgi:putative transposase